MGDRRKYVYIAGAWTEEKDAIEILKLWNALNCLSLSFPDVHETTQAFDTSLPCSIKRSLKFRMNESYAFVFVVGESTRRLTKGGCQNCKSYNSHTYSCCHSSSIDYRSYIEYECEEAIKAKIPIIILYNSSIKRDDWIPDALSGARYREVPMYRWSGNKKIWDYGEIKSSFDYALLEYAITHRS